MPLATCLEPLLKVIFMFLLRRLMEVTMSQLFCEEGNLSFYDVDIEGLCGSEWLARLKQKGFRVDEEVVRLFMLQGEETVSQFDVHRVHRGVRESVIVKGFSGTYSELLQLAREKEWLLAPPEAACAVRETISDEYLRTMDLQWLSVPMLVPFKYWYRYSEKPTFERNLLLCVHRNGAFKASGEPDTGGKHLGVSYTTGKSDPRQGHLFLCRKFR
jgi:hypothetical protein